MSINSCKRVLEQDADQTLTFGQSWENDKNGDVLLHDTNTVWVDTGTIWSTLPRRFAPLHDRPLNPVFQVSELKKKHISYCLFSVTERSSREKNAFVIFASWEGGGGIRWQRFARYDAYCGMWGVFMEKWEARKVSRNKKRKNASVALAMTQNLPSLQREAVCSVLARAFKS